MSADFSSVRRPTDHPTLDWVVTEQQRERAEDYIKAAYANGRLTAEEFDERIGMVISAHTRRDLNQAFAGLASIPVRYPTPVPLVALQNRPADASFLGALTHWSGLFTSFVGPLVVAMSSRPGSPLQRQAARAFNYQAVSVALGIVLGAATHILHLHFVMGLFWVLWMAFTVVGGLKALGGENWTSPFQRVLPIKFMNESLSERAVRPLPRY